MLEEGKLYEECPRCMGSGALDNEKGQLEICDKCDADGYVEHDCLDVHTADA